MAFKNTFIKDINEKIKEKNEITKFNFLFLNPNLIVYSNILFIIKYLVYLTQAGAPHLIIPPVWLQ